MNEHTVRAVRVLLRDGMPTEQIAATLKVHHHAVLRVLFNFSDEQRLRKRCAR